MFAHTCLSNCFCMNAGAGFSGMEYAGWANDLTNLADARTDQSGQAIAYPYNLANPLNPLTCTQALLYAVTLANYDLGAPAAPLPREDPPSVVPFCLTLFNFGALDDFSNFVDDNSDYELFFDNNGDGVINSLARYNFTDGIVFNTTGTRDIGVNTTSEAEIEAAPVNGSVSNRQQQDGSNSRSIPKGTKLKANPEDNLAASAALGLANGKGQPSAQRRNAPPGSARAAAVKPSSRYEGTNQGKVSTPKPKSFSDALQQALKASNPAIQAFADTPLGSSLMERVGQSQFVQFVDDANGLVSDAVGNTVANFAEPLQNLTRAATNLTNGVVFNATNLGIKALVAGLEATEPLVRMGVLFDKNVVEPAANQSRAAASELAKKSQDQLLGNVQKIQDPKLQEQLLQAITSKEGQTAQQPSGKRVQSGKRRTLR
eukprot:GHRR01013509.1.p1 GENE.GHRR01013509.1~~GHRR01013509.1.p1  ORF type:complete len:430 (+),score=118.95 GHRR01013509.1:611-1900(+)